MTLPLLYTGPSGSGGGGSVDLLNGLIGWYRNDAVDYSGSSNNFDFGSAGLGAGIDGGANEAASFTSLQSFDDTGSLIPTGDPFSISVWFYINSVDYSADLAPWGINSASGSQFILVSGGVPSTVVWFDTVNSFILDSGQLYPYDVWWHVVVTYDNTDFKFYINGSLANQGAVTMNPFTITFFTWGSAGGDPFRSQYLGIWNRAINVSEISALYNSGNGFDPTFTAPANFNKSFTFLPPAIYWRR